MNEDMRSKFDVMAEKENYSVVKVDGKYKEIRTEVLWEFYQAGVTFGAASVQGEQEPVAWRLKKVGEEYGITSYDKDQADNYIKDAGWTLVQALYATPVPQGLSLRSGEQCPSELREALVAAIAWIDAVPTYTDLPTMPGFDRDWVDGLLAAQPKEPT